MHADGVCSDMQNGNIITYLYIFVNTLVTYWYKLVKGSVLLYLL